MFYIVQSFLVRKPKRYAPISTAMLKLTEALDYMDRYDPPISVRVIAQNRDNNDFIVLAERKASQVIRPK